MSLACWTKVVGLGMVKNEQIEEIILHAVLSA